MNALVEYIKTHPDWRTELTQKPYCLTIKQQPLRQYYIFSYSQIDSDFYNEVVRVSRGIILKIEDRMIHDRSHAVAQDIYDCKVEVVCWPFNKFGNYGEGYADKIDWASAKVQEKVDGCLDAGTQIETPEGLKSIKELCESHYRGLIKSKDLDTGEIYWDSVELESIQENNDDWYELELEDGRKIELTGNHRIWLPELRCWRQVRDLEGYEKVDVI